jgi:hypothetical protein
MTADVRGRDLPRYTMEAHLDWPSAVTAGRDTAELLKEDEDVKLPESMLKLEGDWK